MKERHLILMPDSPTPTTALALPDRPVPHDPHIATSGNGIARTADEACAGVKTILTQRRFKDSKGREYMSDMTSHVHTYHESAVRFRRLSWEGSIARWSPADAARCQVNLIR